MAKPAGYIVETQNMDGRLLQPCEQTAKFDAKGIGLHVHFPALDPFALFLWMVL